MLKQLGSKLAATDRQRIGNKHSVATGIAWRQAFGIRIEGEFEETHTEGSAVFDTADVPSALKGVGGTKRGL